MKDDLVHYQKIVVALTETIRLMAEIDTVIAQHGGWPGAFAIGGRRCKGDPELQGELGEVVLAIDQP